MDLLPVEVEGRTEAEGECCCERGDREATRLEKGKKVAIIGFVT